MEDEARETLTRVLAGGAETLGISLDERQLRLFVRYADRLLAANARTNLTRITAPDAVAAKHFVDSLSVLAACPDLSPRAGIADIGTGAGFPGVPLKIVRPDLRLTLIDSLNKRLDFLRDLVADLGLENVLLVHARAEDIGRDPAHRDRYDLATARAVAALPTLLEWCAPLVRTGGRFVAMKAAAADEELAASASAQRALRVRLAGDVPVLLPEVEGETDPASRRLLVFEKTGPTPPRFPRRAAEIKARPLA
jgi:16S rRNA (guanine527-N7)-methyltransferase